jgi:hypothetical protein
MNKPCSLLQRITGNDELYWSFQIILQRKFKGRGERSSHIILDKGIAISGMNGICSVGRQTHDGFSSAGVES